MQAPGKVNPERTDPGLLEALAGVDWLLVGASARAAAESARKAGFSVAVADLFGDRQTRRVAKHWISLPQLFDHLETELAAGRDSKLPRGTQLVIVGGSESSPGQNACKDLPFRFATWRDFDTASDPEWLRRLATDSRVSFPVTNRAGIGISRPLRKDFAATGGFGTRWRDRDPQLTTKQSTTYFQQYVCGRVFGASYVSDGSSSNLVGLCRTMTKRLPGLPFVYGGSVGPWPVSLSNVRALQRLGQEFVSRTRLAGPLNIDVVIEKDAVTLLEVNPRWSASMEIVERSWNHRTGELCSFFDSYERWTERLDRFGGYGQMDWNRDDQWLKRILYARRDQPVDPESFSVEADDEVAVHAAAGHDEWFWTDTPSGPIRVKAHQPIATLIARRNSMTHSQLLKRMHEQLA